MQKHVCEIDDEKVKQAERGACRCEVLEKMSRFLKVMADPTRLRICSVLLSGEMCVCELAAALEMEHSAISHQLAVLRANDVVTARKDGKTKYYALSDAHVETVFNVTYEHVTE